MNSGTNIIVTREIPLIKERIEIFSKLSDITVLSDPAIDVMSIELNARVRHDYYHYDENERTGELSILEADNAVIINNVFKHEEDIIKSKIIIRIPHKNCIKSFLVKTNYGDLIVGKGSRIEKLLAQIESGDICINTFTKSINAKVNMGNILINADFENAFIKTGRGNVEISTARKFSDSNINVTRGNVLLILDDTVREIFYENKRKKSKMGISSKNDSNCTLIKGCFKSKIWIKEGNLIIDNEVKDLPL